MKKSLKKAIRTANVQLDVTLVGYNYFFVAILEYNWSV